jgi:hypothetical protein
MAVAATWPLPGSWLSILNGCLPQRQMTDPAMQDMPDTGIPHPGATISLHSTLKDAELIGVFYVPAGQSLGEFMRG